ncbi:alpha/beta hydrolase [Christensenellaceae bacterium OttesenSCG-928-K19]|nr:alpha/beta hydrolase [Christensenellaceae bacterium OttesenSCG-928-K19]
MVEKTDFTFKSSAGKIDVFVRAWKDNEAEPQFILQIAHGMVEYIDRYDDFAQFICANGGAVYGNDHLGHGYTGENAGLLGYFAEKDGDRFVVEDMHKLTGLIRQRHPKTPIVLLGHSMGSFLTRIYATQYGGDVNAVIIMGTSGTNPSVAILRAISKLGMIFGKAKKPANLITKLAFGGYNKRYEEVNSPNEWLSRDRAVVQKYDADPWCTYRFTHSAFHDLANILDAMSGEKWAVKLEKDIPYLLIAGDMDPVGGYGEGVKEVYGLMKNAGVSDLEMKLYPGARHEILNETNKREVYDDILGWIDAHCVSAK